MIEDVLLRHFSMYPRMGPQDALKLIYQQEFGPEHMIVDPGKSLALLKEEMALLGPARPGEPLYEAIGNGLCRLNLRPCAERGISAEEINALFVDAARRTAGDQRRFWQAVRALQALAEEGETPFDAVEMDLFLAHYPRRPQPVHHSPAYRLAYEPAYRVALQKQVKDAMARRREEKARDEAGGNG